MHIHKLKAPLGFSLLSIKHFNLISIYGKMLENLDFIPI